MAETSFEVKYDGEALRDGRMPVRDLAPALLSLGELFTEASLLLFPENEPVSLEIEATKEGSFDVGLILQAAGMAWDQISSMNPMEAGTSLILFKELVIGGSADMSLMGLVKRLKGQRITEEVEGPEPGRVTIKTADTEIVVRTEVAGLNRDSRIRKKLREVVEPLRREGVDILEIRSDSEPTVELEEQDIPAFDLPDSEDEDTLSDQEIDVYLDVLSPTFVEGNKWKFGGLGQSFMAPILDFDFMQKVAQHEETFGSGDQLHVRLQIVQKRDPMTSKIRTERRVVKVFERIEAPEQLAMEERIERVHEDPGDTDAAAG
jgi:hypothetical protein